MNFINTVNAGGSAATAALNGNYILNCDLDLSDNGVFDKAVINGTFTGTFDGNGHTVSGMQLSYAPPATGSTPQDIGFFGYISNSTGAGIVKNLSITDASITATGDITNANYMGDYKGINMGILAGRAFGTSIDNVSVSDSTIKVGNNYQGVGAFANGSVANNCQATNITIIGGDNARYISGFNMDQATNCYADVDIILGNNAREVSGFRSDAYSATNIQNCAAEGSITVGNNARQIVGFVLSVDAGGQINNSYTTVNITTGTNANTVGGFTDSATSPITNSYAAGTINTGTGSTNIGGFAATSSAGVNNTNFYYNNIHTSAGAAIDGTVNPLPTGAWSDTIWDKSTTLPTLPNAGYTAFTDDLETGLRNGTYSLAREANEFTQETISIKGKKYEEIDWRATPEIFDELYKGDDVEAENKYDKTINEINSQDKKLQLEQTTIEVEYKAISSERESVKKILDTNAQSSFKYFS